MSQLRVLYVDDDPDIRDVAELSLIRDPAMEVRTAASGPDALGLLDGGGFVPDVALLDLMMPGMDGRTLMSEIRARSGPQPRVIFITARALPEEVEALKALGAAGVITKPFDPLKLAAQVRELATSAA